MECRLYKTYKIKTNSLLTKNRMLMKMRNPFPNFPHPVSPMLSRFLTVAFSRK